MHIELSEHFTYSKLLRFTFPSIIMMVLNSIYGVVDGFFISNFIGAEPFAAVNIVIPFLMIFGAVGFMIGTGGSALVAYTLGVGDKKKANEIFSLLVYLLVGLGLLLTVISEIFVGPISQFLGADAEMLPYCVTYGRILMIALVPFMLQNVFQSFFVTAEKPHLGLRVIVIAGVTNMVLDFLFVAVLHLGLPGAGFATVCGEFIGGLFPLFYFGRKNSSLLKLGKTHFHGRILLKTCTNGSSELMTNLSSSVVNALYNMQLMKFAGEDGVAAYGTIMYVNFIFVSIFFGYAIGSAPIVSYHYGANNQDELKNLFHKSIRLIGTWAVSLFIIAQLIATPLATLFVGYDQGLFELTRSGFRLYSFTFLINGFNIYGSAFFTALNNGLLSALISFLRTLVFQMAVVLLLPLLLGINGVWCSVAIAELLTLCVTGTFIVLKRNTYHYL